MIYLQLPSDRYMGAALLSLFIICVCLGYIAKLIIKARRQQRRMLDRHPSATRDRAVDSKLTDGFTSKLIRLDEHEKSIS